ncbi:tetratricopeptide repeat protein [Pseudomonas sp. G5(2012)]|uniref:tetratricopeptide repeat protein n=1 Tax=Pseudomonas sp. G5(2012) TaxID=1268068 RepID=UPI00034329DE|nr:tetratricopeptide repeat protein [Pseudomonas sp. G5(2012)]EPA92980.1 tetratricopeptide repeat protein [Pseudomonas sp. G5(2012)]
MHDYYDLGTYSRPVTTSSAQTQLWFDRGLMWCYGYNHDEAIRCFQKALEHDRNCAMAYWGIAYASGPNYNKRWDAFIEQELKEAVAQARLATQIALVHLEGTTPVEQALIHALQQRYQAEQTSSVDELFTWNDAYAASMRDVYQRFPDDPDVVALFVEALIDRTPWQLWDLKTGQPAAGADTLETVAVLERALQRMEQHGEAPHAGVLHMYVHTLEMSPYPERALRAGDILRDLVPDAGHLRHMPSHIDVLCGDYRGAMITNQRAIEADSLYLAKEGPINFYTLYRSHNYHFKLYSAMFLGQYQPALEAAEQLAETIKEDLLRVETPPMADWLESFVSMKAHVQIRFGKWQDILATPLPQDPTLYCVTTAMLHYAKGVAFAACGQVANAETEHHLFLEAWARVPDTRYLFNNKCNDILAVAAGMLRGEIEYRKGNFDEAFAHLREAQSLDDHLPYDEPWGWMQPVRHALGALLLEQGRVEEALHAYRADLGLDNTLSRASWHLDNVWSLHGYVECLKRLGRDGEAAAAQVRLNLAMARADVDISASCFCCNGKRCCH